MKKAVQRTARDGVPDQSGSSRKFTVPFLGSRFMSFQLLNIRMRSLQSQSALHMTGSLDCTAARARMPVG